MAEWKTAECIFFYTAGNTEKYLECKAKKLFPIKSLKMLKTTKRNFRNKEEDETLIGYNKAIPALLHFKIKLTNMVLARTGKLQLKQSLPSSGITGCSLKKNTHKTFFIYMGSYMSS